MRTDRAIYVKAFAAGGSFAAVLLFGALVPAFAVTTPPHVVLDSKQGSTDACAICHRAHTADATVPYRTPDATETTGTSLLIASDPAAGDVSLCFSCHGVALLGSNTDVQSRFLLPSAHSLAPASAAYGPTPLYCSTCHDSHGTARVASDTPFPALLRSFEGTAPVYTGEQYCATCHTVQQGERWNGLAVYRQTGHFTGIPDPVSGTGIRCSICHDPHGSAVAPLLVASLIPTSVPATFTVTADDRTFCGACHGLASASWEGTATYASSSHASSNATVPISARWVPGAGRKVGECQVCHAPMGRSDGSGGALPKLLDASGRALCDRCHAPGGVASTDTSSEAYPADVANKGELAVVYSPDSRTAWAGRASLYGRTSDGPDRLIGPREYAIANGAGAAAAGDVDADGLNELVVASPGSSVLTLIDPDPLTGLSTTPVTVAIPGGNVASRIVVANVIGTLMLDRAEIVVLTAAGTVKIYDYNGSTLTELASSNASGAGPWDMAVGDVVGSALPDVAITGRDGGTLRIMSDSGLGGALTTSAGIGGAPVAPAIGELYAGVAGQHEIAVLDALSTSATIRLFDASTATLASYALSAGDGRPVASAVGDVLWNAPSPGSSDLAVSFVNASGDSTVIVIPQVASGAGLDIPAASASAVGAGANTASLLVRDIDGDGRAELVAGSGGTWARDAGAVAPFARVLRAASSGLALSGISQTYPAGGTELAGGVVSLVFADLGPVLPSRHPVDEVAVTAHVSTETAPFVRHATCSDCHDSHEATQAAGIAPAVPGPLAGARGVSVTYPGGVPTYSAPARSVTGYGICLKCHSSYVSLGGRADVAVQFRPVSLGNGSVHAIEESSTSDVAAATFVAGGGWTPSSVLYCTDCHGDDGRTGVQASGPHTSASAPILNKPYEGAVPDSASLLCFSCHRRDVYAGTADASGLSAFATATQRLHNLHVAAPANGGHGVSCGACHVSHGSVDLHLLRRDGAFTWTAAGPHGGTCSAGCHNASHTY